MSDFHYLQTCRLCGFSDFTHQLHLPASPLANNFTEQPTEQKKYPLEILSCDHCGHNQLSIVIDPKTLFDNYLYTSGPAFKTHWQEYAKTVSQFYGLPLKGDEVVCDLGSNDGGLLQCFAGYGFKTIGVEPAIKIAQQANENKIPTLNQYFTAKTVSDIKNQLGTVKIVCCNNAFAHIDNLRELTLNIKNLLDPFDGIFVLEVQYLPDLISKGLCTSIYHEHISHHHLSPLIEFFWRMGMKVLDAHRVDTHDGSIRIFVANEDSNLPVRFDHLRKFVHEENDLGLHCGKEVLFRFDLLRNYANTAWVDFKDQLKSMKKQLAGIIKNYQPIVGYGAAAKATALLSALNLNTDRFMGIIDDSPLKVGKFSPINNLPILSSDVLYSGTYAPPACLILATNFADRIITNHQQYLENHGQFIRILPNIEVIKK